MAPALAVDRCRSRHVAYSATQLREVLATGLARDIHGSVRMLVKSPGFSATVVLTLAICLGANAAIFTVVHDVLLRPLPLADPDRIVAMGDIYPTITPNDILSNDTPSYFDRLEALTTLEQQGLFTFWFDTLTVDSVPQEVRGIRATPSLFRVLQVPPLLGRTFTDAEGETGNDQKVILSYALWQRLFGSDPNVVGRPLRLAWNGGLYTIVGVMPREFRFFDQGYGGHADGMQGVQFWIPLAFTPEQKSDAARTRYGFFHVGRLRPGATVDQVQAQLDALHAANVKRFPQFRYAELGMYSAVTSLQEALTRPIRRTLYLLWAGAGVVLLIGAFNVANLTLARANGRRRELATRVALGAGRLQVARQLLIEALLPAILGGAGGLAIGGAILAVLAANGALADLPNATDVRLHTTTVIVVFAVALAVGVFIGLVPAVSAGARTIPQALGDGSRSGTRWHGRAILPSWTGRRPGRAVRRTSDWRYAALHQLSQSSEVGRRLRSNRSGDSHDLPAAVALSHAGVRGGAAGSRPRSRARNPRRFTRWHDVEHRAQRLRESVLCFRRRADGG